jgi:type I restriction enzyme S subunit
LGEICKNITSGGTPLTNNRKYYDGNIPWLRTQEVDWVDIYDTGVKITEEGLKNSSAKWIPENCVIVAMYGATAAKVGINKIPLTTNQACCNLEIDETQANYKYVFHWLCKEYETLKALGEGTQHNINGQKVKKYKIPIPPLEEQARIVAILDKFEALLNDISVGLPVEIAARRQQYEYYRNKLLTFNEAA